MDNRAKHRPAAKDSLFICHSINIQRLTPEQRECPAFITPRYKKSQDSNMLNDFQRKQISTTLNQSLIVHRPYGMDV